MTEQLLTARGGVKHRELQIVLWPGALLLVGQRPLRVFSLLAPRTRPKSAAALLYTPRIDFISQKNADIAHPAVSRGVCA